MMNLFFYKFKNQFRVLLPIMAISLIVTIFWYLCGLSDQPILQIICKILSAAAMTTAFLPLMATILLSWLDFYNTFFGRRAYLIRTLPFSRSGLYVCSVLCDLLCILICLVWPFLILGSAMAAADQFGFFELYLQETGRFILLFACAMFLQAMFIELCGLTGGLFGFRMNQSRLPWSVGFGILIYFIGNLLMVPVILIYVGGNLDTAVIPTDMIGGLLWLIIGAYSAVNLILLLLDEYLVHGRTDVE